MKPAGADVSIFFPAAIFYGDSHKVCAVNCQAILPPLPVSQCRRMTW